MTDFRIKEISGWQICHFCVVGDLGEKSNPAAPSKLFVYYLSLERVIVLQNGMGYRGMSPGLMNQSTDYIPEKIGSIL